jgi:hypothetical protein
MKPNLKACLSYILPAIIIAFQSCKPSPQIVKHGGEKDRISFKPVFGVTYTEISRHTENGLSFNEDGYQLEPQWRLNFVSNDSASIYSPVKGTFINFPLTRGYDSVFNTARTWLKVKAMTKDSLKLEILKAYGDTIDTRGAKIFMILYADDYIKNKLHSDTAVVKRANKKDSLYIKKLTAIADKDFNKAFAARQPVELISKSPTVTIKKRKAKGDLLNHFDESADYMTPHYDLAISKAYTDFHYSFSIFVDSKGLMHYGKPLVFFYGETLKGNYIKHSKAIMESYLKYYLVIKPGSTLGIVHASEINVHVIGKMKKKVEALAIVHR